ncbi:root phototropism protein 3-like isoform X3 [Silene latifolia]|uniref:root phototropism protein 3-like isoform X1 n=2 Tax=Silene latifolia TaxID=37657 RepID=UPI003D782A2C
MNKLAFFGHEKAGISGRRSYDKRSANSGSVLMERPNRCMIVPSEVDMIAEAIEKKDTNWFVRTKVPSDLIIHIGKSCFHLHMLSMVSRSAYLNRIIFEKRNKGMTGSNLNIELNNLPGGEDIFELIVKFCYGWKVDLTANNVAPLYCAANFLEMIEDLHHGNLISRTESFLCFIIFSSWKDTFLVFKTCETISSSARDLQIQRRCSEAIAWKICTNLNAISIDHDESQCSSFWWFEDVAGLRIDHFIEVVTLIKKKGVKPEVLGSCVAYWTAKWISRVSFWFRIPCQKGISQVRRVTVESLIRVLPIEENSVSCNFLLHLLKLGLMMNVDANLCLKLSKRVASMLEQCHPLDLLVKNYGESETSFDVSIIVRILETYVSLALRNPTFKLFVVGRLVDGYLALVARDKNLQADSFRVLAESLPKSARYSHDNLYQAIDRFLKAHPNLTEEERKEVCRSIEYDKLSEEAREHVMKNDRLPLNITTQFILLEQVNLTKSVVESGSIYRRTKAQTIINLKADSHKECMQAHKDIKMMKQETDNIQAELNKLQECRLEIKRLARKM